MHKRRDFFYFPAVPHPDEFSDTKKQRAVTTANAAMLGCKEYSRQPSTICSKLGIPSAFLLPHLLYVPYALREKAS